MNVKKFTSYAVALMMSISLAPINANALTTDNAVTNGYYNESGQWVQGELYQTLPEGIHSVDKTAEAREVWMASVLETYRQQQKSL